MAATKAYDSISVKEVVISDLKPRPQAFLRYRIDKSVQPASVSVPILL